MIVFRGTAREGYLDSKRTLLSGGGIDVLSGLCLTLNVVCAHTANSMGAKLPFAKQHPLGPPRMLSYDVL